MKGIVLSGGSGTRLYPATLATAKPLLPVYDKPMIYYPLSLLLMAGIRDIMIITTERDKDKYEHLFGDGSRFGINMEYAIQYEPKGIAESLMIAEDFIGDDCVALMLGDNILEEKTLAARLVRARKAAEERGHATIFGYYVDDPTAFGVVGFDENGKPTSLLEKPKDPPSNYCVIGVYFYDNRAPEFAKSLTPSARGELEITDVNRLYLEDGTLELEMLDRDATWFDAGTFDSMAETTNFIMEKEKGTDRIIACIEEISYRNGWLGRDDLLELGKSMANSHYGEHLIKIAEE